MEACNFQDDDGDGVVDDGFRWVARGPSHVLTTMLFAHELQTLPAADGSILAIATDGYGTGSDRIAVMRISASGELVGVPTMLPTPEFGPAGSGIALIDDETVGVIFGSEDYLAPNCPSGCPVTFCRLDARDLSLRDQRTLDLGFPVHRCVDLGCSSAGCVTLATESVTADPHLVWFDPDSGALLKDRALPPRTSRLAFSRDNGIAWVGEASDNDGAAVYGVWSTDGSDEVLPQRSVRSSVGGAALRANSSGKPLLWFGERLLLSLTATSSTSSGLQLALRGPEGEELADRRVVDTQVSEGSALGIGGNLVAAVTRTPFGVDLYRLTAGLQPVAAPGNPIEIATGAPYISVVSQEQRVLVLTASYDGRSIESWEVTCP